MCLFQMCLMDTHWDLQTAKWRRSLLWKLFWLTFCLETTITPFPFPCKYCIIYIKCTKSETLSDCRQSHACFLCSVYNLSHYLSLPELDRELCQGRKFSMSILGDCRLTTFLMNDLPLCKASISFLLAGKPPQSSCGRWRDGEEGRKVPSSSIVARREWKCPSLAKT